MKHILDVVRLFHEFLRSICVERDIYREVEIFLRSSCQEYAQLFYVLKLSISIRIGCQATLLVQIFLRLELGETLAQIFHDLLSISRVDKH